MQKTIIHLQVYIFNEDETGNRIIHALLNAAKKGVNIFIVLDGYASKNISKSCIEKFKSAGIHFRWFNPIFKSRYFYFGRRLHHKIIVADNLVAMVGGLNITNRYNDFDEPAWLDWALHVQGDVCLQLNKICEDIWNKSYWGKRRATKFILPMQQVMITENCRVRVRVNDWVRNKKQITATYIDMLKNAKHSIIIMSSYFFAGPPDKKTFAGCAETGRANKNNCGRYFRCAACQAGRALFVWLAFLKQTLKYTNTKKLFCMVS